jgi:hypothetical protein
MKEVGRELEVKECRFGFLELAGRREHVMRQRAVSVIATSTTTNSSSFSNAVRTAWVSAAVMAGLPLSTHNPRTRSGWSVSISSGNVLGGNNRPISFMPVTFVVRPPSSGSFECAMTGMNAVWKTLPPCLPKLPVNNQSSLDKYVFNVAVFRVFNAEVRAHASAFGLGVFARDFAHQRGIDVRFARVVVDRDFHQHRAEFVVTGRVRVEKRFVLEPFLHDRAQHRQQQMRVAAGRT